MQSRSSSPAIRRDFARVPEDIVQQASAFPASVLADVAGRRGTLDGRIMAISSRARVAGPAFTVEVRPGDNLMIHAAIAIAQPGDVIVVDGKGDRSCALMGAIMMTACKTLGIAGVVLDGSHRDTEEILALGYPVYSVGANPNGPTKNVPGRINWPISCGGVAISPGDLVVGDGDGVVVVERDYQIARIVDRVGVEIVSVGDSVGMNLWGQRSPTDVTLDEMMVVCKAVRRGVTRALVSCDFPPGPLEAGTSAALDAASRLAEAAGADMVKLDGAAAYPEAVRAISHAGIAVFAQMEVAPGTEPTADTIARLVEDAKRLQEAGASLIDFKYSGPAAGAAVAGAVSIPVLGGLGGGPWLDGRLRMAHAAIGYDASHLDTPVETYANVAKIAFEAISAYADDVRAGRQIKSGRRA